MTDIINKRIYLQRMKKTFMDKSWFMSIVPEEITTIVDFGCADNSFIDFLCNSFPDYEYIGIENNPDFVKAIRDRGEKVFTSIKDFILNSGYNPDTTLLVLNSVVHEVYSYADPEEFWQDVKEMNPKCIAFRDMYAKGCGIYTSKAEEELKTEILKSDLLTNHYADFKDNWGELMDGYTAAHFLLKYFYTENWDREVKENYLPYHYRELHTQIRKIGYDVTFERFYGLPFLKDKWHKDFSCDMNPNLNAFITQMTTHMKLFIKRAD
jgi:hypothetical protein